MICKYYKEDQGKLKIAHNNVQINCKFLIKKLAILHKVS